MKIVFSEKLSLLHLGNNHPMRGDRYEKAIQRFYELGLNFEISDFSMAEESEIALFHTTDYIQKVKEISRKGYPDISPDTPGFKGIYEAAAWSVGATLKAVEIAKQEGLGINLAGGWHHAFPETGRGFCIFSDTGISIQKLRKEGKKVMIIDYDAHHGDGIQRAFGEEEDIITVSFHQDPATLYPYLTGYIEETHKTNINVPLPPLSGSEEFVYAFSEIIPPLINRESPDFLIVEMGVDGHCGCYVANLSISKAGYREVAVILSKIVKEKGIPTVLVGGGGFVYPHYADAWAVQIAAFDDQSIEMPLNDCITKSIGTEIHRIVKEVKSKAGLN